jgi:hypothetical protein
MRTGCIGFSGHPWKRSRTRVTSQLSVRFGLAVMIALLPTIAEAAFEQVDSGARPFGMGGAYRAVADDADGWMYSPVGSSELRRSCFAVSSTRLFGMPELSSHIAAYAGGFEFGHLGLVYATFGYSLYQEHQALLCYSRDGELIAAGIGLRVMALSIEGYGSSVAMGIDLGVRGHLPGGVEMSLVGQNINRPEMAGEALYQSIGIGASVRPRSDVLVACDLVHRAGMGQRLCLGHEFTVRECLLLRAGVSSDPTQFSLGIGLRWRRIRLDHAVRTHFILGPTHQVTLVVEFP